MTNLKHNNRELTEWEYEQPAHKHIQRENSHHNIVVRQESLDGVYQKEFGQALEEYNAKQKERIEKLKIIRVMFITVRLLIYKGSSLKRQD